MFLPRLKRILVLLKLFQHEIKVPLSEIACFITCVQNSRILSEVDASDREVNLFLAWDTQTLCSPNLHLLVQDPGAQDRQSILAGRGCNSVKVEIALSVSGDQTVVTLEELADLYLRVWPFWMGSQNTLHLLVLVILYSHVTVV